MSKRTRDDFEEFESMITEAEKPEEIELQISETGTTDVDAASIEYAAMEEAEAAAALQGNVVYAMDPTASVKPDELCKVERLVLIVQEGPKLSLTLVEKPNILDGCTLIEKVDENLLNQLINSTLLQESFGVGKRL